MTPPVLPKHSVEELSPVRATAGRLLRLRAAGEQIDLRPRRGRAQQSGHYLSPFKGRGMEFDEVRPYQQGDDVRNIDWRVTARTGKPHTKLFREERERPTYLWIDLSPSMHFATRRVFKSVVACEVAALLAWSAAKQGDRTGGLLFSGSGAPRPLKPGRGSSAVAAMIHALCQHPAWEAGPAIGAPVDSHFGSLLNIVRPGSLVFLIGDFRSLPPADEQAIRRLSAHSDLALIHLSDPLERELPPPGTYRVTGNAGEFLLNTAANDKRTSYRSRFLAQSDRLATLCRTLRCRYIAVGTEDDPAEVLRNHFGERPL